MRWLDYPFYRILFFLTAGIIFSRILEVNSEPFLYGLMTSFVISTFFLFVYKYTSVSKVLFALSVYSFFFFLGGFHLQFQNKLSENHFFKKQIHGKDHVVHLKLEQRLTPNVYNNRFYAEVIELDNKVASGKTLVFFKRSDSLDYKIGDEIRVYEGFYIPAFARNPGDFDYRKYLKSIDVYGQIYVGLPRILYSERGVEKLGFLLRIRNSISNKLATSGLNQNARGMIEALVLGQRHHVDPEVTKSFRDAGVIHILALSGLHVGIILLILRFLMRRVLRLKYGRWIQSAVLIILLWSFALLTGMSPSIMRAVTMFSFVAVGMNLKRKGSVYHGLTLSAFVLLTYDPRLLFQVGFQLSYMAVFSIVLIQPVLYGLWTWRNKVKDFFWSIFTVTLAAQIGVAGVSLFYFQQFPGLFILGNMLLLPLLPVIIATALLMIALLMIGVPTAWLAAVLNIVFEFIIKVVAKISSLEAFIIRDVHISLWETVLIYIALFSLVLFLLPYFKRSRRERFYLKKPNWMLHLSLSALILFTGLKSFEKYTYKQDQFLVLHQSIGSAVSLSNPTHAVLLTDFHVMDSVRAVNSLDRLKAIKNHRNKELSTVDLKNLVVYKGVQLMVIGEHGIYDTSIKKATILLSHSPKINLERLILQTNPKMIITDGSNYRNVVKGWKLTCHRMGVKLCSTYEEGAVSVY
jgi:competence protein ComEC